MAKHSSATAHKETPHANQTTTTNLSKTVRRRAQAIVSDRTIDAQSRALIRFALEINDPCLAELVRRADVGESLSDTLDLPLTPEGDDDSNRSNVEALTEMICGAGEEASAALLVLMAMLQNSATPKVLANAAKHVAFTRCGEFVSEPRA